MKIKYKSIDICAHRCYHPGDIREVDDKEGNQLIAANAAVKIADTPSNKVAPEAENKAMKSEDNKAEPEAEENSGKKKGRKG